MNDNTRLIERAFPLKQASLDSVHEKNVRHGHISTLHIWPARRPLAACRAALIATLLPDPGTLEERQKLCERIGGKVVQKIEKKKMPSGRTVERIKEETEGGILHWLGSEPTSGGRKKKEEYRLKAQFFEEELEWFRRQIRKAYGGRAPRILDPFAGGGAIPLEAMRLGCETTAVDINPVAWFILKCTLKYPQKLAGKTHPLPEFVLEDEEFMSAFFNAHPELASKDKRSERKGDSGILFAAHQWDSPAANLTWHVRAWGKWVLDRARRSLAKFYPTYADFEPLKPGKAYEKLPMRLVPLSDDGTAHIEALNAEFSAEYLADPHNPRWVAKPTVAYMWARTVSCKNCRAKLPLLKTRWLCKKAKKRVLLTMEPNSDKTGVEFGIEHDVPVKGGNAAQRREHDKRIGAGTMSRAGAWCPCCQKPGQVIMTMEDIRLEGRADTLGEELYSVVVDGTAGKEYRLPTEHESATARVDMATLERLYAPLPAGIPEEQIAPASTRSISCHEYGLDSYGKLMTPRQTAFIGAIAQSIREVRNNLERGFGQEWAVALAAFLACVLDKCLDYGNTLASWYTQNEQISHLFNRYALPMKWDYAETAPFGGASGSWDSMLNSVAKSVDTTVSFFDHATVSPVVECASVLELFCDQDFDVVITDPPYYQAVSYADLSDFFYVWLRCIFADQMYPFHAPITPKEGEIVQHIRSDKDRDVERNKYEAWMAEAFRRVHNCLRDDGRFAIVFAHKDPLAWETLVGAIIRAGFTVDASWPIQTEMPNRSRGFGLSALSSSIWLIGKKRPATARPGWDNRVLEEMRANIAMRLREFWDAGIRGPDFVWAATGPALEAYSKHPVVKKANDAGKTMGVGEFLSHVRRMVVDFVVGRVLTGDGEGIDLAAADRMDAPTAYYLLHRHDFGLEEAPSGACILYATACGLSDQDLESTWDILVRTGAGSSSQDEEGEESDPDAEADPDEVTDSGSKVKLKTWTQRKNKSMGYEAPRGQPVPLIDRIHRLMHLWRAGDVLKVDEYLDDNGLRRHELFRRLLQSLIELSPEGSDERTLLESLSNHVQAKGAKPEEPQAKLAFGEGD